jgi:hypothetical protein
MAIVGWRTSEMVRRYAAFDGRAELTAAERRALGLVRPLDDPGHRSRRASSDPEEARAALARLTG